MSRTDKDRPYWVKLNDEGVEDHDHTFTRYFRRTSRIGKALRDDDGNIVMQDVPVYRSAEWIATNVPRVKSYAVEIKMPLTMSQSMRYTEHNGNFYHWVTGRGVNALWAEAQRLVNIGRGGTELLYRTDRRPIYTMIEIEPRDYCTIDEPVTRDRRRFDYPCSKEMPATKRSRWCSCSMCEPGGIYAEKKSRTAKKNILREMTKAANCGEEQWEDAFEAREFSLDKPLRYITPGC